MIQSDPAAEPGMLFQMAIGLHQAGRLAEAEPVYRQVLALEAGHLNSLQNLAMLALQTGRKPLALELIERAVAVDGQAPGQG